LGGKDRERAEKKINREFAIQSNGLVDLENKYGNLDIAIGESNQVKINVTVSVVAPSVKKAQETLDRIDVEFEEGNNRIHAKTEIESTSGWFSWFSTGNTEMEINYHVLVPVDVYLELTNNFGNIYVETTNRDLKVDLGFGDIRLGDINANLKLDMQYSGGTLSQIKNGDLNLSYSTLEMEDGEDVILENKYTDIKTGSFKKLRMESSFSHLYSLFIGQFEYTGKYDDLVVDRSGHMNGESSFTTIVMNELESGGDFDMRYGDLKIHHVHRGFQQINLNTSFTGVELHLNPDAGFAIDADTKYCEIHHGNLKIEEDTQRQENFTLKASRGTGEGKIYARMSYGELNIE
jgi:hypothetical protein